MCLLCEELWMPFSFAPEPSAQKFVADAPDEKADASAQPKSAEPHISQGSPRPAGPAGPPDSGGGES